MKTNIIALAALISGLTFASTAEKMKAPNGGRIIDTIKPHAEFVINADKKIEIRFLDGAQFVWCHKSGHSCFVPLFVCGFMPDSTRLSAS